MNDAQTWTAIGGMLAVFLAFMALMVRLFEATLDAKFETVTARFDAIDQRLDNLDRDVQAITRRIWDGPSGA